MESFTAKTLFLPAGDLAGEIIREILDHATFRAKVQTLGWLDKLWDFSRRTFVIMPTLTTCNFQSILFSRNVNINKKYME